ncbi:hypothetical protein HAX54_007874 [Datura stramonium]|uniref:Uncharacterized protein n=1 Tax=Datura stramonium TaxID=4076 RepID=A0ABS8TCA8_DATST|nr:hypothetical protein [Datura stramonium]
MVIINKTRPSCARVKVQVDLLDDLPNLVKMEIKNDATGKTHTINVKYNTIIFLCTAQSVIFKGMILMIVESYIRNWGKKYKGIDEPAQKEGEINKQHTQGRRNKQIIYPDRILTSGKIIGEQDVWREIKVRKEITTTKENNSPIKHQVVASKELVNTSNKFDLLNIEEENNDEEGTKGREEVEIGSCTNIVLLDRSQQHRRGEDTIFTPQSVRHMVKSSSREVAILLFGGMKALIMIAYLKD